MSSETKKRKRVYLVNRDFQLRYTWAAVAVGLVSTILTATIVLYPLYIFEILRIPRFLPMPILGAMSIAVVVNIVLVALMGIFVTHRIAGPMFSLVRGMRRVEAGRWRVSLRVRDGDELRYVIRNFNEMIAALCKMANDDLALVERALESVSKKPGNEVIIAQLEDLRARVSARVTVDHGPKIDSLTDPEGKKL